MPFNISPLSLSTCAPYIFSVEQEPPWLNRVFARALNLSTSSRKVAAIAKAPPPLDILVVDNSLPLIYEHIMVPPSRKNTLRLAHNLRWSLTIHRCNSKGSLKLVDQSKKHVVQSRTHIGFDHVYFLPGEGKSIWSFPWTHDLKNHKAAMLSSTELHF